MASSEPGPPAPRARPRRWRRRLAILAGVLAAAYAALWVVRLTRDFERVPARAFLAGGPLVFAHRGASAVAAEHSLEAYRRALAVGADVLELDVRRARDGALVLAHDAALGRALGVDLAIADHDLAALRAAVAARHPGVDPATLLPTLDEVLAGFPGVRLNVELKVEEDALADAVAGAIDRAGAHDRVLVASFRGGVLERFRVASRGRVATSASPGEVARFLVCYLLDVPARPSYEALQLPVRVRRGFPQLRLDGDLIEFAHRHGLEVHYWTVADEAEATRLFRAGADGVMSDDPAIAVRARAAAGTVAP
jgi:glycerophosphoryl diester phosphodiesterase